MGVIFDKLDSLGHDLFGNEMGMGKTKVSLSMIKCRAIQLEKDVTALPEDQRDVYLPTLIINPVSTIPSDH